MAALLDRAALGIGRQLALPSGLAGRLVGTAMHFANRRPTDRLIEALAVRPGERILDIGCGDGSLLAGLPQAFFRAGIDRSPLMVRRTRRRLSAALAEGRAMVREGDMMRLPFGAGAFDRLFASNILYFCSDVPAFVAECRRVARPGAQLGIYVTAAESMQGWRVASHATHRHFTGGGLVAELEQAGIAGASACVREVQVTARVTGLLAVVPLRAR
ncbi:class I SAM-dependent methyltransferase [Sphingomonas astaxanthinifaciens]|uniref:Methyltransferase type 11 domain-containing protein n=1 Tax=Sphingomonas astaxanthinifaciens DSM 22298 TaxID=1123267 RepID=A0ABQ5Z313_9SPHN|nr:class I SAM-dependent methyltransferase [Sphingomonas astaxanthinifaciens]GLR46354.1 hypothetical protein GCM10007925_00650 [Sphingomonas astaxanthinifaciens DSM 22298]